MAAVTEIKRGATFSQILQCVDEADVAVDMTGWTVTSELRGSPGRTVQVEFAIDDTDAADGQFVISATAAETAEFPASCTLQYDLKIVDGLRDVHYSETLYLRTNKHITD